MSDPFSNSKEIQTAFAEYDRKAILNNVVIGCMLGTVLMPLGTLLDYYVYRPEVFYFFKLRLFCSLLIGIFWMVVTTSYGRQHPRKLGVLLAFFPAFFISWMIYATEGESSPYYAGLNLVLLVVGFVLHWTIVESFIVVSVVILMYVGACALHGGISFVGLMNNLYFLVLTGIIVVTGSFFHSKTRFREFAFRYQLDKSKGELEESNRKLVELDRLKSRFFANISHELRTPLTLLLSPLESLMQRADNSFDARTREVFETMHANAMRLLKLINDLLDLIRLESGRMDIKNDPVHVADFLKGLASAVKQVAVDKHITLETHVGAELDMILTDRDKVEKMVLNLLFNALKFTPENGRVELRAEKQGDHFVLSVSDTGVGISEKNLPFVFDRFWQADNSSRRKFHGVGIGLALVKELVEMMHGSVTVQSQEGKGTVFTVKLPYQKAVAQPKPETAEPAPAQTGAAAGSDEWLHNLYRRAELFPAVTALRGTIKPVEFSGNRPVVLVAEDEPDMQRFLKSELQKDYDVISATDGVQALEKAEHLLPDIILLDMMMPEMDGLEVCQALRKRPATMKIPVILLTARADEETKFEALQKGANDFLAKPFSSTELQARIKNLIESHHYQRKLSKQNVALTTAIEQIKETETQLVQSEKLASLGRLSAGIIHEINNPLNFTMTGLFTLRNKGKHLPPEQRGEYEDILNDIEEGLKRVRNIVSDLRTFTHPGGSTGEPVDVAEIVGASLRFLAGEWKDVVHIEQNLPPNQMVWANRNKLIHVLVNLVQNSIDALAEKKFEDGERATIWIESRTEAGRGLIVVRDNGMGIEQKVLDKVFDPFFTTKEVGKGMGLGLSICYRIVQGYGGKISVKSERGKYCEFTLDFPAKREESDIEPAVGIDEYGKSLRL
jgi:signal transduction histidine kinase